MKQFDYSIRSLSLSVAGKIADTASLKAATDIHRIKHFRYFKGLEFASRIHAIKYALAIEGTSMSGEQITYLDTGHRAPETPEEKLACGYARALDFVSSNYTQITFCEKDVLTLYRELTGLHNSSAANQYRDDDKTLLEMFAEDKKLLPIVPIPFGQVAGAMNQMYAAYKKAESNPNINNLFLIPYVIVDFLSISPFKSHNLIMALLIINLLLRKSDYDIVKYISFEEKVTTYLTSTHEHIRVHISEWDNGYGRYNGFSFGIYSALCDCYLDINERYVKKYGREAENKLAYQSPKADAVRKEILKYSKPFTKSEISKKLIENVSSYTVDNVVRDMVASGELIKNGNGKSAKYVRPKPIPKESADIRSEDMQPMKAIHGQDNSVQQQSRQVGVGRTNSNSGVPVQTKPSIGAATPKPQISQNSQQKLPAAPKPALVPPPSRPANLNGIQPARRPNIEQGANASAIDSTDFF